MPMRVTPEQRKMRLGFIITELEPDHQNLLMMIISETKVIENAPRWYCELDDYIDKHRSKGTLSERRHLEFIDFWDMLLLPFYQRGLDAHDEGQPIFKEAAEFWQIVEAHLTEQRVMGHYCGESGAHPGARIDVVTKLDVYEPEDRRYMIGQCLAIDCGHNCARDLASMRKIGKRLTCPHQVASLSWRLSDYMTSITKPAGSPA